MKALAKSIKGRLRTLIDLIKPPLIRAILNLVYYVGFGFSKPLLIVSHVKNMNSKQGDASCWQDAEGYKPSLKDCKRQS